MPLICGSGASSGVIASSAPAPEPFFFDLLLEFLEAVLVSGGAAPGGKARPLATPNLPPGPFESPDKLKDEAVDVPSPLRECGGT